MGDDRADGGVNTRRALLAATIALTACRADKAVAPAAPYCTPPAPISNTRDPRDPDIFVLFKSTVNGSATIARLQEQFNFTVLWEPTDQTGFLAALSAGQIASMQCDPAVASLEWDSGGAPDSRVPPN
jgi:hypothetical protein